MGEDAAEPEVEFLDVGPSRTRAGTGTAVRHRRRWPPLLLFAGIIAALVVVVRQHSTRSSSPTTGAAAPSRTVASSAPAAASTARSSRPQPPIAVTEVGHRLLDVTAGWELFGRGNGVVVRIQLARGRITQTTVPGLGSSGPVGFIVGPDLAMVRPIDFVPGYVVPDGKPARPISASLSQGQSGPVFPGPDPNLIWVPNLGGRQGMTLSHLDSAQPSTTLLPIPADTSLLSGVPDGAGYLLYPAIGGVYAARPDGLHRITTGQLLAVGPTGWLTRDCDSRDRCVTVYLARASNARRVLGAGFSGDAQPGEISPDGTTAALLGLGPNSPTPLSLLDLQTGVTHRVALLLDQVQDGTIVWSPDSRWLFAVGAEGKLYAIDARTRHITTLLPGRIQLPPLRQLAVRVATTN